MGVLAGYSWLPRLAQAGTTLPRINKPGYSFLNSFSEEKKALALPRRTLPGAESRLIPLPPLNDSSTLGSSGVSEQI